MHQNAIKKIRTNFFSWDNEYDLTLFEADEPKLMMDSIIKNSKHFKTPGKLVYGLVLTCSDYYAIFGCRKSTNVYKIWKSQHINFPICACCPLYILFEHKKNNLFCENLIQLKQGYIISEQFMTSILLVLLFEISLECIRRR